MFAQVTNPPIDPLREGLVMSLMSFTGKQRNLLDETPQHCRQLKLSHPILTNEDIERLRACKRDDFRVVTLPAVFDVDLGDPGGALERAFEDLVEAAAQAIRDGASLLIVSDREISPRKAPIPSLLAIGRIAARTLGTPHAKRGRDRAGDRRAPGSDARLPALRIWRQGDQSRTWRSRPSINCTKRASCRPTPRWTNTAITTSAL